MKMIFVFNKEITYYSKKEEDYISLTDIAKYKNNKHPSDVVKNWLRKRNTIEFLGLWEKINNYNFKLVEFDQFRFNSGINSFVLPPQQWIKKVNAIGLISKSGKGGGTYAHKDIAFEFASWVSPEFKLYLIKEFQRLKIKENKKKQLGWNIKRDLAKINYKIHTNAIKENLIPKQITKKQKKQIYANEADILNIALFGMTAKEWHTYNKNKKGNIRDYAKASQLICLSNLENLNALFISQKIPQEKRLIELNRIAIKQMKLLLEDNHIKKLEEKSA